jgi:hypothetical protein
MKLLDEISANDAIKLYYEKHHALSIGDMSKLIELKDACPDLFDKEKEKQIRDMIEYVTLFKNSDHYRKLRRLDLKKKLEVIISDKNQS